MNDIISSESWMDFVVSNYKQIFLLFVVVFVVYCVEYLTYFNARLYGMIAMPIIPGVTNTSSIHIKKNKKMKN